MEELVIRLTQTKQTLASIESITAGLFSAHVANVSGASKVLKGSLVTYQTQAKIDVLHVSRDIIDTYGVISKQCALAMARAGMEMFDTSYVVSCTGNAGPTCMDEEEVGLVFVALVSKSKEEVYELHLAGNRESIREQVCMYMNKVVVTMVRNDEIIGVI